MYIYIYIYKHIFARDAFPDCRLVQARLDRAKKAVATIR